MLQRAGRGTEEQEGRGGRAERSDRSVGSLRGSGRNLCRGDGPDWGVCAWEGRDRNSEIGWDVLNEGGRPVHGSLRRRLVSDEPVGNRRSQGASLVGRSMEERWQGSTSTSGLRARTLRERTSGRRRRTDGCLVAQRIAARKNANTVYCKINYGRIERCGRLTNARGGAQDGLTDSLQNQRGNALGFVGVWVEGNRRRHPICAQPAAWRPPPSRRTARREPRCTTRPRV